MQVDVLVVGLGPAGAAAARAAAKGLKVLAVDRRRRLGEPVQCAEYVPRPFLQEVPEGARVQPIRGMRTFLAGEDTFSPFPGLMIDRAAFDRALAREAEGAGAWVMPGTSLRALAPGEALLENGRGRFRVRFALLIAADGPRSRVAKLLGLPPLRPIETRQYTVPLRAPQADTDIWLGEEAPGGYAWCFPKGEVAHVGIGADPRLLRDLRTPLEALRGRLVGEGRIGGAVLARTGGAIPVSGLRERLVAGGALFAGDAAGLTHPITGAGIAPAVISGRRAGEAAAAFLGGDAGALEDYEEDLRDQFQESLARAVRRRAELDALWPSPPPRALKRSWIAFEAYFRGD